MTELVSFRIVLCCHASFPGMKKYCDVLCRSYVDPASIYRILPQTRPDPDPDTLDPDPGCRIFGRIRRRIWIRCNPTWVHHLPTPFASFLTFVVDKIFFFWSISATIPLTSIIIHMSTYGAPDTRPFCHVNTMTVSPCDKCYRIKEMSAFLQQIADIFGMEQRCAFD